MRVAAGRGLENVRRFRNEIDRRGHHPLLFFLKCMEAEDARLPELMRDEIMARDMKQSRHRRAYLLLTLILPGKLEEARRILAAIWRLNAPARGGKG